MVGKLADVGYAIMLFGEMKVAAVPEIMRADRAITFMAAVVALRKIQRWILIMSLTHEETRDQVTLIYKRH